MGVTGQRFICWCEPVQWLFHLFDHFAQHDVITNEDDARRHLWDDQQHTDTQDRQKERESLSFTEAWSNGDFNSKNIYIGINKDIYWWIQYMAKSIRVPEHEPILIHIPILNVIRFWSLRPFVPIQSLSVMIVWNVCKLKSSTRLVMRRLLVYTSRPLSDALNSQLFRLYSETVLYYFEYNGC